MSSTFEPGLILIVVGTTLRAEDKDRPLAYRLADEIDNRLNDGSPSRPLVVSDVLYLNHSALADCPTISLGGPGVNRLTSMLSRELPSVLAVDNALVIQMDLEMKDRRCCLWGMDHAQTVQALDLFMNRGHLESFLAHVDMPAD
jgi:hypothetical protein